MSLDPREPPSVTAHPNIVIAAVWKRALSPDEIVRVHADLAHAPTTDRMAAEMLVHGADTVYLPSAPSPLR